MKVGEKEKRECKREKRESKKVIRSKRIDRFIHRLLLTKLWEREKRKERGEIKRVSEEVERGLERGRVRE